MNKLTKYIISVITVIALAIISFQFSIFGSPFPYTILLAFCRLLIVSVGIFLYLELAFYLRDLINIKYRIVNDPKYRFLYEAEYLTLNILCIPVWKPVKYKFKSYESQNVFGATFTNYYESTEYFRSELEATEEIENHKKKMQKNRLEWTESKNKEKPTIKYL